MDTKDIPLGMGVRRLTFQDQIPNARISINKRLYILRDLVRGKSVIDIGCGYGRNRKIVEEAGGTWVGVEPFEGGGHTVVGSAEDLPFESGIFDIAIMDAVLEHVPDVAKAFSEVSRVLKPGGIFVGYVAYMECFHEISYSHLSFKALEHYSSINGMKLTSISGGGSFGIDYHLGVIMYPIPFKRMRRIIASLIRGIFRIKSYFIYLAYRLKKKLSHSEALTKSRIYFQLECLRQSNGFGFMIEKT